MKSPRLLSVLLLAILGLPAFAAADGVPAKKSYAHKLQLADRIRIAVYQEDDLTTLARVDSHGQVALPLVGAVSVGGMTVTEAQDAIQKAYRDGRFLRNPQVTINVEEYAPSEVSIQGQIRNPGRYTLPIESTYTVVELVTKAGGLTDIGKGSAVTVTRILPDGSKKVFTVNVDAVIKGKKGQGNAEDNTLLLEPGDIVYVPESLI
ncbi:MAG TPA: polysaccharide biosynthesis/export family protein [Candidatus Didemnitutus sp.]|nr:polysaccharide biosynthesis/export family protein [Candidatus Didemnitutus sp.]